MSFEAFTVCSAEKKHKEFLANLICALRLTQSGQAASCLRAASREDYGKKHGECKGKDCTSCMKFETEKDPIKKIRFLTKEGEVCHSTIRHRLRNAIDGMILLAPEDAKGYIEFYKFARKTIKSSPCCQRHSDEKTWYMSQIHSCSCGCSECLSCQTLNTKGNVNGNVKPQLKFLSRQEEEKDEARAE